MSIPETFSWIDLDGRERIEPLRMLSDGRVTPLTPAVVAVLPLEQLEREKAHYLSRSGLSGADLRMMCCIGTRMHELTSAAEALEQALADAEAVRDAVLAQLEPYNREIEYGTGWFSRAQEVRHEQLLARLDDAETRVRAARAALARHAAVAA